jgi:hypothetical protein
MPRSAELQEALSRVLSFHWFFTDQVQTWNCSHISGREARMEVILFESGDDPTTAPVCIHRLSLPEAWLKHFPQHNLPPLSTVKAVQSLAATPQDLYFEGYCPESPLPPAADRILCILSALPMTRILFTGASSIVS